MKVFKIIFVLSWLTITSLTSCVTNKASMPGYFPNEKLDLDVSNDDFSKSAKEAIAYLKTLISDSNISTMKIEIFNFHGGVYVLNCSIEKNEQLLSFQTTTTAMDNSKEVTTKKIKIADFIISLNDLELNSENQLVIAGNYQKIYISAGQHEKLFLTRKAFGLLSLLK